MKLIVVLIFKFDGIVCEGYAVCQCAEIYDMILYQVLKFRVITVRLNILTLRGKEVIVRVGESIGNRLALSYIRGPGG